MDQLLKLSAEYETETARFLSISAVEQSSKIKVCNILCRVAFEHSESIKILITMGNFTSAVGILRMQFEAIVRAHWSYFAASDLAIEKMLSELTTENENGSYKIRMLGEMLSKMEAKAPPNALAPLLEFRDYSWKPLSSYVHGGTHAINRHSKGYPVQLLEQVLRNSNGLNGLTAYFWAQLSGYPHLPKEVFGLFSKFKDCLPPDRQ